eukprot:COSAG02_NODE_1038_length_15049_cov_895.063144_9_plen_104_part_00
MCPPLRDLYDLKEGDYLRFWSLESLVSQLGTLKVQEEEHMREMMQRNASNDGDVMAGLTFFNYRMECFTHIVHSLHECDSLTLSCTDAQVWPTAYHPLSQLRA